MKRTDFGRARWFALLPFAALGVASCTVFDGLSAVDRSADVGDDASTDSVTLDTFAPKDTAVDDSSAPDSTASDSGTLDSSTTDSSTADSGTTDSGTLDTSSGDTTPVDTAVLPDTAAPDTSVSDTSADTTPLTKAERYRAAVLADSPLLYLRLDEMTGTLIAVDSSSNMRDCAYSGAELGLAGAMTGSNAARLNNPGSNESIECDSTPFDFAGTQPFTIEAWVNVATLPSGFPRIVSKEVASPRSGYTIYVKSSSEVVFERWEAGVLRIYSVRPLPGTATWVHIAATWNGTDAKLFVNGVPDPRTYSGLTFTGNSRSLTFGLASSGVGEGFPGMIDEVAVYGTALSTTRIAAHISAATAP